MDKNDNTDRNNAVLLIVIAIATMIIVVVGATFAYFADTVEKEAQANISGSTNGSKGNDMFVLDSGNNLYLNFFAEDFQEGAKDAEDSTLASVSVAGVKESSTYKYDIDLDIAMNEFEYSSGKCYYQGSTKTNTSKEECLNNNNLWARTSLEINYSCYPKEGTSLVSEDIKDEFTCASYPNTIWAKEDIPELVVSLYKETNIVYASDCYKEDINNIYEVDKCFKKVKEIDVTEMEADRTKYIPLLKGEEITSIKGETVTNNYLVSIKLLNLSHNQNINRDKMFVGHITLSLVDNN